MNQIFPLFPSFSCPILVPHPLPLFLSFSKSCASYWRLAGTELLNFVNFSRNIIGHPKNLGNRSFFHPGLSLFRSLWSLKDLIQTFLHSFRSTHSLPLLKMINKNRSVHLVALIDLFYTNLHLSSWSDSLFSSAFRVEMETMFGRNLLCYSVLCISRVPYDLDHTGASLESG